jgi:pentose-5-phosphate-3-epimerase/CBS domain-containing protein
VEELNSYEVGYFHIDCKDDLGVFDDIAYLNAASSVPVDLHIISKTPQKFFELIRKHKIEQVSFQLEEFSGDIKFPSDLGADVGLAITSSTPVEAFEKYKELCSFVLLMTTTPGQSGGKFDRNTFQKIRQFRKAYPTKSIQVDGGVNAEVSFILRNLGVETAVVGSYLFNNSIGVALHHLKKETVGSHFRLKDFMLSIGEIPVVKKRELSFEKALKSIEDFDMAFTLVVDELGKLDGLISNADVRRGLLRNLGDLNRIPVSDIINPKPLRMEENKTIHELLAFIKRVNFPLQYLPVVNAENRLVGAILFTNLIKGEL